MTPQWGHVPVPNQGCRQIIAAHSGDMGHAGDTLGTLCWGHITIPKPGSRRVATAIGLSYGQQMYWGQATDGSHHCGSPWAQGTQRRDVPTPEPQSSVETWPLAWCEDNRHIGGMLGIQQGHYRGVPRRARSRWLRTPTHPGDKGHIEDMLELHYHTGDTALLGMHPNPCPCPQLTMGMRATW